MFSITTSLKKITLGLLAGASLMACDKDDDMVEPVIITESDMSVPTTYAFESRFADGVSSVGYGGQTVRNMLVSDIKILIDNAAITTNTNLKADILSLYNYADTEKSTLISTTPSLLEDVYKNISTGKNLSGKINTSENAIGYGAFGADDLFLGWVDSISTRIANGKTGKEIYITSDSVDLNQLINKTLLGSVVYYQGTDIYLDDIATRDNDAAASGENHTAAEHRWDEAFGYYGAARNYTDFTDEDLASKNGGKPYADANSDGKIDLRSEYNFGFSTNAGKRDLGATNDPMFTTECFNAFLAGRTAITNERSANEIESFAKLASQCWEKVIAATVVHYINDTKADLATRLSSNTTSFDKYDLYKHWSEMRGFTISLQYGSENFQLIDNSDLTSMAATMGNDLSSVLAGGDSAINDYIDDLEDIANTLRLIYNFDGDNVANWRKRF